MNKHDAKDYLPLVQALADGKKLEINLGNNEWISTGSDIVFSNVPSNYRIVSEPPRVITLGKWRMRNGGVITVISCDTKTWSSSCATKTWYKDGGYQLIEDHPFDLIAKIETKWRRWHPDEVLLGREVRMIEDHAIRRLITYNHDRQSLYDLWELLLPDGTYSPCGVEEEVG